VGQRPIPADRASVARLVRLGCRSPGRRSRRPLARSLAGHDEGDRGNDDRGAEEDRGRDRLRKEDRTEEHGATGFTYAYVATSDTGACWSSQCASALLPADRVGLLAARGRAPL